jgi:hypothetical protein
MPVHIRDFSVETENPSAPEAPAQTNQTAQPRPQTARQVAALLKAAQQRACRLHAD